MCKRKRIKDFFSTIYLLTYYPIHQQTFNTVLVFVVHQEFIVLTSFAGRMSYTDLKKTISYSVLCDYSVYYLLSVLMTERMKCFLTCQLGIVLKEQSWIVCCEWKLWRISDGWFLDDDDDGFIVFYWLSDWADFFYEAFNALIEDSIVIWKLFF